ncbi:MAG: hypothetical protein OEL57_08585 [Trichlorobacter sp.]|uniref:hypothetical protein n=1 Tax=Trichlorobacter sp. TaxID=2911007 RepID=UPI00256493B4|nr:hypothetical protein [Trichlorobacter sp.]MDK9717949.1 hypothetical protein [Trichlorobacter sp.]
MGKINIEEVEVEAAEYRARTPLDERIKEVDRYAADPNCKPLSIAVIELLLIGNDMPMESLRYLPAEYMQKARA